MHRCQGAGGNHWSLNWHSQQLNYFKPRACRMWLAHSLEVKRWINLVCLCLLFFFPSNFFFFPFFFWYLHLAQWINFVPELICDLGCFRGNGREQASQPSCCSWAVLLYSCCLNDVQLFIHGTISDMVTLLLSSLMWSYLFSEGSGFGTSVVLRSPFKTNSRRQKAKSRSGRQRGQGKQGREQHSSSISGSCWVSRVTGAVTWQCASVFLVATHSQGPAVSWI